MPVTYTLITSGGHRTTIDGYLSEIIEAQRPRRTSVGIYWGSLLVCTVCQGEVLWAI